MNNNMENRHTKKLAKRIKWKRVFCTLGIMCAMITGVAKVGAKSIIRNKIAEDDIVSQEQIQTEWVVESESEIFDSDDILVEESNSQAVQEEILGESIDVLQQTISQKLDELYGTWAVYVKNLDTGESFSINNQPMYSASLIKLYAMSCAYEKVEQGAFSEDYIYYDLEQMITVSSNESFNSVVLDIGRYYINEWCEINGYSQTYECHGLYPSTNGDAVWTASGDNTTSVNDCGLLLESIYNGECVSQSASEKMLDLLLNQQNLSKIPAGVPEGVKVANKTGETDDFCHDTAIVYSDGADYILCVMAEADGMGWASSEYVSEISKMTYEFFNPQ